MVTKSEKSHAYKEYARENPTKSRSQIYEHFKHTEYGMRKTDALKIIREERNVPHPVKEKREVAVSAPYREKRRAPTPPLYTYVTAKLQTKDAWHDTYYIKFTSKSDFRRQFNRILTAYQRSERDFIITYLRPKAYGEFHSRFLRDEEE